MTRTQKLLTIALALLFSGCADVPAMGLTPESHPRTANASGDVDDTAPADVDTITGKTDFASDAANSATSNINLVNDTANPAASKINLAHNSTNAPASLYNRLGLDASGLPFEAFEQAYTGYRNIPKRSKDVLTLIDFSKPSTEERLYVIDMAAEKLLFHTHVSHGQNSGENYATSFSNVSGSHQSSLGFFLTEGTYQGRNGYSLIIDGLEKGINDRAKSRAIVVHGAKYANPSSIGAYGRLGRSFGCPALPTSVTRDIIDTIKGGSVLFIYAANEDYTSSSTLLSGV